MTTTQISAIRQLWAEATTPAVTRAVRVTALTPHKPRLEYRHGTGRHPVVLVRDAAVVDS